MKEACIEALRSIATREMLLENSWDSGSPRKKVSRLLFGPLGHNYIDYQLIF